MAAFTYTNYAYDPTNGSVLVGAEVHAIRIDTGISAVSTTSSATGLYSLASLDTTYDYKIEIRTIHRVQAYNLKRAWAGVNLAADQTLTNFATADVNDCSIVIGPGVWLAYGHGTAVGDQVGSVLNLRVYDGTTEYGGASFVQASAAGASRLSCTSSPITVAAGASKTVKLQIYFASGGGPGAVTGTLYAISTFSQITHFRVERIG